MLKSLGQVRTMAKEKLVPVMMKALSVYTQVNQGHVPTDLAELKPYFEKPIDDAILERFQLRFSGNINEQKPEGFIVSEKKRFSPYDTLQRYQLAHTGSLSQLKPGQGAIQEKERVDQYDTLHSINPDMYFRNDPPEISPDQHTSTMTSQAIGVP